ncbi:DUF6146 family protein [Aequorivita echinoideorum]|uniref:Uncharacterized protein n=1 Tax=Aequorivita echinoideorum TaxID=1549647 RepID=A0ABS5S6W6_9FLAO|nr:DUF6146 family protein [Aequorivita echinoideorum]MBT0608938.1 hypothetical protein [Aequorivita echinoideorum]
MKTFLLIIGFSIAIYSCGSGDAAFKNSSDRTAANDTIRIANDSLEYEIIIIEPGFQAWLASQPPRGFYGQPYLEVRNRLIVNEYNNRVRQINRYPRDLYVQEINYDTTIDYGYEVNYLLYNYFLFFQRRYNQKFIGIRN